MAEASWSMEHLEKKKKFTKHIKSLKQANVQQLAKSVSEKINIGKTTNFTHIHTRPARWIENFVKLWTPKRTEWSQRRNVVKLGHSLKGEECLGINVCLQGRTALTACAQMKACEWPELIVVF